MTSNNRLSRTVAYAAAVAFLSAGTSVCLYAQSAAPAPDAGKAIDLKKSLMAPIDLTRPAELNYSSSASSSDEVASAENFMPRFGEDQPPPRRTYGRRTNYSDRWHNPDGSNKYTFNAGAGFTLPTGSAGKELGTSWKFQVGAGYNFSKKFAVLLQYDYDKLGLTSGNINRQYARYTNLNLVDSNGNPISLAGLDGNAHMWSFTLNPMYTFYQGDSVGAYVIGGGGFYRKITNWTLPQTGVFCDFFGFCYQFTQNQTFDHYSNNAGGVNGGIGFTYRFSRFASEKLYAEARYVWVDNQPSSNSVNSYYPENNKRTGYFPITVGIRW
ncbi:outer membrane beta-barrel protein [Edaphobacter albus]|uniref:outer membrane beta-barrel protein n=1 Tax=Edaphobacter sp. 4G125 TaxID=2763071 RepID=UPI001646922C|nr:outer membrane beta-barrel protein [Edaphobacter sp. 4G125]QNI36497.1 outer membrane beta-barrel protein [Edaphobacter sp. 4G125]